MPSLSPGFKIVIPYEWSHSTPDIDIPEVFGLSPKPNLGSITCEFIRIVQAGIPVPKADITTVKKQERFEEIIIQKQI